jgi:hypothetical protein
MTFHSGKCGQIFSHLSGRLVKSYVQDLPYSVVCSEGHWFPSPLAFKPPVNTNLDNDIIVALKNYIINASEICKKESMLKNTGKK